MTMTLVVSPWPESSKAAGRTVAFFLLAATLFRQRMRVPRNGAGWRDRTRMAPMIS
jgi:hypothetical protein